MSYGIDAGITPNYAIVTLNDDGSYEIAGSKDFDSYNSPYYYVESSTGTANSSGKLISDPFYSTPQVNLPSLLVPGDTVTVYSGLYSETIPIAESGLSGNEITWIFKDGVVVDVESAFAITLESKSYVNLVGEGSVIFSGYTSAGLKISSTTSSNNINISNLKFLSDGSTYSVWLSDTNTGDNIIAEGCYFGGATTSKNLYAEKASKIAFYSCVFEGSVGPDIGRVINTSFVSFSNCDIIGNNNNSRSLIFFNDGYANIVNSIIYGAQPALADVSTSDTTVSYSIIQYDQSFSGDLIDGGNNLVNTDPLFTDAANNDFTLTKFSPCVNSGTIPFSDGDGDQTDYAGNPIWSDTFDDAVGLWGDGPDIGAYGYNRPSTHMGVTFK
jgi:hypothetical protein